jgi:hypothetical protein
MSGDDLHEVLGRLALLGLYAQKSKRKHFSGIEIDRIVGWKRADVRYVELLLKADYIVHEEKDLYRLRFPPEIQARNHNSVGGHRSMSVLTRGYDGKFRKKHDISGAPIKHKPRLRRNSTEFDGDGNMLT